MKRLEALDGSTASVDYLVAWARSPRNRRPAIPSTALPTHPRIRGRRRPSTGPRCLPQRQRRYSHRPAAVETPAHVGRSPVARAACPCLRSRRGISRLPVALHLAMRSTGPRRCRGYDGWKRGRGGSGSRSSYLDLFRGAVMLNTPSRVLPPILPNGNASSAAPELVVSTPRHPATSLPSAHGDPCRSGFLASSVPINQAGLGRNWKLHDFRDRGRFIDLCCLLGGLQSLLFCSLGCVKTPSLSIKRPLIIKASFKLHTWHY